MGKIGKISPIKRKYSTEQGQSLATSLSDKGYTMFPGTVKGMVPYKEKNGDYRTGLDPEALYIKRMMIADKEAGKQEIARVTALRDELKDLTGINLSSKAKYYADMFNPATFGSSEAAVYVRLEDKANLFNLSNAQEAITFAWLRVHPEVAPTYDAWERNISSYRCPLISTCQFFVDDEEYESEVAYKHKNTINKAVNALTNMSPTRQLKVAKLLNLPVTYNSKPEVVYNELDNYIKSLDTVGKGKKVMHVANFTAISKMTDDNLDVRFRIKEAVDLNVYRFGKAGKLYEGEVLVADSEDELVEYLTNTKNQEDYLSLQKKISNAKSVEI